MNLTVKKIEEQFNLYFKGEKKLEAIKEWANKYDVYKEEIVFSPNENKKGLLKWIKILKNIKIEKTQKLDIEKFLVEANESEYGGKYFRKWLNMSKYNIVLGDSNVYHICLVRPVININNLNTIAFTIFNIQLSTKSNIFVKATFKSP